MTEPLPDFNKRDGYSGNGWSQYQIFVLKQLEDHNSLMARFIEKNNDFSVSVKLMQKEIQGNSERIREVENTLKEVIEEKKDNSGRIKNLENEKEIRDQVDLKTKMIWGTIGGGIITALTVIANLFEKLVSFIKN